LQRTASETRASASDWLPLPPCSVLTTLAASWECYLQLPRCEFLLRLAACRLR
jgi:hypothetical protein